MSGETEQHPSSFTTDSLMLHIESRLVSTHEYVDSQNAVRDMRMDAMDKANEVLDRTIHQVPTDLQTAMGNLDRITTMRMDAIETVATLNAQQFSGKFAEFDARLIRDLAANSLQVAAAFAASEKLSIALDAANKEAIAKSEASTAANAAAQGATITDVKDRLTRLESRGQGGTDERNDRRLSSAGLAAMIGATVGILGIILAIVTIIIANKP